MKHLNVLVTLVLFAGFAVAQQPNSAAQNKTGRRRVRHAEIPGRQMGRKDERGREKIPTTTSFRLVSDNSALMNVLGAGTPHEMVTMFHMDGSDLLATHYCAIHNQPRFRFVSSSEPNVVAFEFKDATNLASPTAPHMVALKITLLDPNHHFEDWTFFANGKTSTSRFDFRRKM